MRCVGGRRGCSASYVRIPTEVARRVGGANAVAITGGSGQPRVAESNAGWSCDLHKICAPCALAALHPVPCNAHIIGRSCPREINLGRASRCCSEAAGSRRRRRVRNPTASCGSEGNQLHGPWPWSSHWSGGVVASRRGHYQAFRHCPRRGGG